MACHGIDPPSLQSFSSHILHGVCLQSQFPSHSESGILSSHFENNAHFYFHSLYEFLLSADLSFPFLREIVTAFGVPPDVVSASHSSLDMLNFIEFFRDGFASCLDLSSVLCSVHDFSLQSLLFHCNIHHIPSANVPRADLQSALIRHIVCDACDIRLSSRSIPQCRTRSCDVTPVQIALIEL